MFWKVGNKSDGVQAEIDLAKTLNKSVRYFDINKLPQITELINLKKKIEKTRK